MLSPRLHLRGETTNYLHQISAATKQRGNATKLSRHYYDINQLLDHPDVITFINTSDYHARKKQRFRKNDNLIIAKNEAFLLTDPKTREQYMLAYQTTASLYFGEQISFDAILGKIQKHIGKL